MLEAAAANRQTFSVPQCDFGVTAGERQNLGYARDPDDMFAGNAKEPGRIEAPLQLR